MRIVVWVFVVMLYYGGVSGTLTHFSFIGDCGPERKKLECSSNAWIAAVIWPVNVGAEVARWSYQQIVDRNVARTGKPF